MYIGNINKVIVIRFCQRFHLYIHAYALLLLARGLTLVQISLIESIVIGAIFLMEVPTGLLGGPCRTQMVDLLLHALY